MRAAVTGRRKAFWKVRRNGNRKRPAARRPVWKVIRAEFTSGGWLCSLLPMVAANVRNQDSAALNPTISSERTMPGG
jgi:hypothetical protein